MRERTSDEGRLRVALAAVDQFCAATVTAAVAAGGSAVTIEAINKDKCRTPTCNLTGLKSCKMLGCECSEVRCKPSSGSSLPLRQDARAR
jgi:hypothetical protein